jgi:transcriptional regulator with XRE-family HTH domain
MIPEQCRAARGLVNWNQTQLAAKARVDPNTVRNFESGRTVPLRATLDAMQRALEEAGVVFTNGNEPGVKLKSR